MPQASEHQSDVYGALNLYEVLMKMCFGVFNRTLLSTEVDNLYVYLGLREALVEQLLIIAPLLPNTPSEEVLPETVSGMTDVQYSALQAGFAPLKGYANQIQAHTATISPEIQSLIRDAEMVLLGKSLPTSVLLSECEVGSYDYETKTILINRKPVVIDGALEDYFSWAMYKHPISTIVSWDVILGKVTEEFGDGQAFKHGADSMRRAMYRVNRKIKTTIGTKDDLFSYKRRGFVRNFGPAI